MRRHSAPTSAAAMPNLLRSVPVVILAWVAASTLGLTRTATGATRFLCDASRSIASSSGSDSTLNWKMPAASAAPSSRSVLPTPENTTRPGATPARSARSSSPPETMSAPAPISARVRTTARFELALSE